MNIRRKLEASTLMILAASAAAIEAPYAQVHVDALRSPARAVILDFFALTLLAVIGLVFWLMRREKTARADALLDNAWNEVLSDPHYAERRRTEEQKRGMAKSKMSV
jgi:cbb3-type cytochrome oxidase subunit 3